MAIDSHTEKQLDPLFSRRKMDMDHISDCLATKLVEDQFVLAATFDLEEELGERVAVVEMERVGTGIYMATILYAPTMYDEMQHGTTAMSASSKQIDTTSTGQSAAVKIDRIPLPGPRELSDPPTLNAACGSNQLNQASSGKNPLGEISSSVRTTAENLGTIRSHISKLRDELDLMDPRNPQHIELVEAISNAMTEYAYQTSLLRLYTEV